MNSTSRLQLLSTPSHFPQVRFHAANFLVGSATIDENFKLQFSAMIENRTGERTWVSIGERAKCSDRVPPALSSLSP